MDDNTKTVMLAAIPALGSLFTIIANHYFRDHSSCEDVNGQDGIRSNHFKAVSHPDDGRASDSNSSATKATNGSDRSIVENNASSGSVRSPSNKTSKPDT